LSKDELRVMFQVFDHAVAWFNVKRIVIVNRLCNNNPPREVLVDLFRSSSDQFFQCAEKRLNAFVREMDYQPSLAPETASILQQEVFDFMLAYSMSLRDPAVKPYITRGFPKRTVMMAMLFFLGKSPLSDTTEAQLLIPVEATAVTKQRWHATAPPAFVTVRHG
jgi:hypothetical protein